MEGTSPLAELELSFRRMLRSLIRATSPEHAQEITNQELEGYNLRQQTRKPSPKPVGS